MRALLRERDALAMQILQTQREIDYTRAKSASYLDELQGVLPGLIEDLRTWVAQRLNENRSGPVPNVPSQISLLRGVLTVRYFDLTTSVYCARLWYSLVE